MDSDQGCLQRAVENSCPGDELKAVKDFLHKTSMIKLESLKRSSHFQRVLKHRVINSELFTIYRTKNFINKTKENKKLYVSFVMKKKIGNAVKRNRIKRKLKFIVHKLLKIKSIINLNYTYIIFGKEKVYKEKHDFLLENMKKSFKSMDGIKL